MTGLKVNDPPSVLYTPFGSPLRPPWPHHPTCISAAALSAVPCSFIFELNLTERNSISSVIISCRALTNRGSCPNGDSKIISIGVLVKCLPCVTEGGSIFLAVPNPATPSNGANVAAAASFSIP